MENLVELIYFLVLFAAGYLIGSQVEKRHYQSIEERERSVLYLPCVTSKNLQNEKAVVQRAQLVSAGVVISADFFKTVLSGLRNLLGGEVSAYETVLDRGRREAILRLKEKAIRADIILNLRVETSQITKRGNVEVFAYGTAVYYQR